MAYIEFENNTNDILCKPLKGKGRFTQLQCLHCFFPLDFKNTVNVSKLLNIVKLPGATEYGESKLLNSLKITYVVEIMNAYSRLEQRASESDLRDFLSAFKQHAPDVSIV